MSVDYDTLAGSYDGLYAGEQAAKHRAALELAPPAEPVLDAGCGTGLLLELLDCYFVGLDLSAGMLKVARHRARGGDLVRGDARLMPFRDRCFGTVYSVTVAHEAPQLAGEVARVLRPGGRAVVTLLRKRLELLPLLLRELPGAEVVDAEGLKDVLLVYRR